MDIPSHPWVLLLDRQGGDVKTSIGCDDSSGLHEM